MINRDNISDLAADACRLCQGTSILGYHIVSKRVTHTSKTLTRLIAPLARMVHAIQTTKSFGSYFKQAFDMSVDHRGGSYEIRLDDDGSIWIRGSFKLDELRKHLVTVPQHPIMIFEKDKSDG